VMCTCTAGVPHLCQPEAAVADVRVQARAGYRLSVAEVGEIPAIVRNQEWDVICPYHASCMRSGMAV